MKPFPANFQQRLRTVRRFVLLACAGSVTVLLALLVFIPVDESVKATGTVVSERDTYLFSPMDGVIDAIIALEGTVVKKGSAVLNLNDTPFREKLRQIDADLDKARSELSARQAALDRGRKIPLPKEFWHANEDLSIWGDRVRQSDLEHKRAEQMAARGLISQQELERARMALSINRSEEAKARDELRIVQSGLGEVILDENFAQLQKASSALRALEIERELCLAAIERCSVRAPEDGMVTLVLKRRRGESVKTGEDLVHLAHGKPSRVELDAVENQYHRVVPGQQVRMTSNAFDPWRHGYIEGIVEHAGLEPIASGSSPAYRVIVRIESTPQPLVVGSTVTAEVILSRVPLFYLLLPRR